MKSHSLNPQCGVSLEELAGPAATESFVPRIAWGLLGAERKAMGSGRRGKGFGFSDIVHF